MATFKKILDINRGTTNILEVLRNYVFGDSFPSMYDIDTVYSRGELILKEIDNKLTILQAIVDQTTAGFYNESEWMVCSVSDVVAGGSADNIFIISKTEPVTDGNKIWIVPHTDNGERYVLDMNVPEEIQTALIFDGSAFPISEYDDLINKGTPLFFDPEGETFYIPSTVVSSDINIDDGDVVVSDTQPNEDSEAIVWIDTNIKDDGFE